MMHKIWGLALMVGILASCGAEPDSVDPSEVSAETPAGDGSRGAEPGGSDLTYEDITLTETSPDGRILWRVTASVADYDSTQTTAQLQSVSGELFDPDGGSVRIQASGGQIYPLERRLALMGGVEVQVPAEGIQVTAARVEWRAEDSLLEASDDENGVALMYVGTTDTPIWQATGSRLTYHFGEESLRLWNLDQTPVTAQAQAPVLSLQAQEIRWDPKAQTLTANNQVLIDDATRRLRLEGSQLVGHLDVQALQRVSLTGGAYVLGLDSNQQLWADRIDWVIDAPTLEATGNVRYQQPGQSLTLTGSSATYNQVANTIAVRGNATTTQLTLP